MNKKNLVIIEMSYMLILAFLFNFIPIVILPVGKIGISIFPIIVFAIRRGYKKGMILGLMYGVMKIFIGHSLMIHPLSLLLDFIVAGIALGLVGYKNIYLGFLYASFVRFVSYFISGVIVYGIYAKGMNPYFYSFFYNIIHVVPEMILQFIIIMIIMKHTNILKNNK